jgi:RimJ/RimL family protein N-acetyltransferase
MLTPVTLEGNFVRLEPLGPEHLDGLCAVGLEPSLWELTTVRVATRADMEVYIASAGTGAFAVVHRASGRVAGSTRYMNYEPAHKRVEIGSTWYGVEFQRTAVNTECKLLLLRHAFTAMGMNRVELKTDGRNTRSQKAILRMGAVYEGTLRKHMIVPGFVRDTVYFSVLREEWPEVERRLEQRLLLPS